MSVLPSRSPQYGPRQQCAEPQTGSSSTPTLGAKNRETKSNPGVSARAVTITPRTGSAASAGMLGLSPRTAASEASSTRPSNLLNPENTTGPPTAAASADASA